MKKIIRITEGLNEQYLIYINSQEELGKTLRRIRQCKNLSQAEIAKAINMERSIYAYYELGKSLPSVFTLIRIAKYYQVDIRNFLTKRPK